MAKDIWKESKYHCVKTTFRIFCHKFSWANKFILLPYIPTKLALYISYTLHTSKICLDLIFGTRGCLTHDFIESQMSL